MKVKLLKKLRKKGRNKIHINSVTTTNDRVTGMSITYSDKDYMRIFKLGMTKEEVYKKAEHVFISKYLFIKKIKNYLINHV